MKSARQNKTFFFFPYSVNDYMEIIDTRFRDGPIVQTSGVTKNLFFVKTILLTVHRTMNLEYISSSYTTENQVYS